MDGLNVFIIILLILVIFWVLNNWLFKSNILMDIICDCNKNPDPSAFSGVNAGLSETLRSTVVSNPYVIPENKIDESNTTNIMLSVWFYIYLWDNTSNFKNVLFMADSHNDQIFSEISDTIRQDLAFSSSSSSLSRFTCVTSTQNNYRNISIHLDKQENNLLIDILTNKRSGTCNGTNQAYTMTRYIIRNIDVQKWNCLTLSIDTTTLDIYLDGKLINSFVMPGTYVPNVDATTKRNLYIGSADSNLWNGFVTRVRYSPNSINPEEAYSIYKDGINASLANSVFNKYGLKVQFLEYNKPYGEFTI